MLLDLVMPVLIVSALDEQGSVARCIEAGAEDYLPKGVDPVLLRARMGACLRKTMARSIAVPSRMMLEMSCEGRTLIEPP